MFHPATGKQMKMELRFLLAYIVIPFLQPVIIVKNLPASVYVHREPYRRMKTGSSGSIIINVLDADYVLENVLMEPFSLTEEWEFLKNVICAG